MKAGKCLLRRRNTPSKCVRHDDANCVMEQPILQYHTLAPLSLVRALSNLSISVEISEI